MACGTREACGFTDTLSAARRCRNHSEVMIVTNDAEDAGCPAAPIRARTALRA